MELIVVSDIFGRTPALDEFLVPFSERYGHTTVVDPYAGQYLEFSDEKDAYRTFQQRCGLKALTVRLRQALISTNAPIDVIGFSVGATALWHVSKEEPAGSIRQAVCFYGSRIRELTELEPLCPTTVVLPQREDAFDIAQLVFRLEDKKQVEIINTNYLHGFMNRLSRNFSPTGYSEFCNWLLTPQVARPYCVVNKPSYPAGSCSGAE